MTIDWLHFTWLSALLGGLLIGLGTASLRLLNGQIAGISGILGGLLSRSSDHAWRIAFLAGLLLSPLLYGLFHEIPAIHIDASSPILLISGLLVGFGTRLGNGCTSGHGVCGLAQGSRRSLLATTTFIATGMATVYLTHHLLNGYWP